MTTNAVRTVSLMAATISMGLIAGTFNLYSHTIMPGLKRTDARTFVGAFQAIDRAIINPWFIGATFLGALAFTVVATVANRGHPAFPWVLAALVAYALAVAITAAVHVPLNDAIKAASIGDNVSTIRAQFNEAKWAAWNLVRVVTSMTAFILLTWALVTHGRAPR
jgi:uncharacterized membrane protein